MQLGDISRGVDSHPGVRVHWCLKVKGFGLVNVSVSAATWDMTNAEKVLWSRGTALPPVRQRKGAGFFLILKKISNLVQVRSCDYRRKGQAH